MRWHIVGAGAIGGVLGARLWLAGEQVRLVARGAHLHSIQQHGLTLVDGTGRRALPIPAVAELAERTGESSEAVQPDDAVVLAVKSQHTADLLAGLARTVPAGVRVICAQNGIANEAQAARMFARVYGMSVSLLASHLEPGVVIAHSAPTVGTLQLGGFPVTEPGDAWLAEAVTALRSAGFEAQSRVDVRPYKHAKLLVNLGTAVEALCGPDARTGRLAELVTAEGERCLRAAGLALPPEPAGPPVVGQRLAVPRSGGSAWQSLSRGTGDSESDYLNGEIVLLGRLHGIPTPANELVQRTMWQVLSRGAMPASMSEQGLLNALARD